MAPIIGKLELLQPSSRGNHTTPEMESHRPYAQGEDLRYVDWNLYARMDRFFIKTFSTEEEGLLNLVVDTSASMRDPYPEKRDRSLEIATGIAYLILFSGNKLVVHSCSDRLIKSIEFMGGERDSSRLIQNMASLPQGQQTDLNANLSALGSLPLNSSSRIILITDLLDVQSYFQQIDRLRARGSVIGAIQILHPREIIPAFRGNLMFVDSETGEKKFQTVGYRKLQRFRQTIKNHLTETENRFGSRHIPYLRVSTQSDFESTVLKFMTLPGWREQSW